jgi:hypothetical protein
MLFITMHSNSLVPQQKLAEYRFNDETLMLLRNLMDALYATHPSMIKSIRQVSPRQ